MWSTCRILSWISHRLDGSMLGQTSESGSEYLNYVNLGESCQRPQPIECVNFQIKSKSHCLLQITVHRVPRTLSRRLVPLSQEETPQPLQSLSIQFIFFYGSCKVSWEPSACPLPWSPSRLSLLGQWHCISSEVGRTRGPMCQPFCMDSSLLCTSACALIPASNQGRPARKEGGLCVTLHSAQRKL